VKGYGKKPKNLNLTELRRRFYVAAPILSMPIVILGGIYTGILTPTEAGVVACIYSLFFVLFIFRTIKVKEIIDVFAEAAQTSGMILFIVMGAMLFGFVVTVKQVPQALLEVVLEHGLSWPILMIFLNLLLLGLGCFLDVVSCMLITVPIAFPLFKNLGVDPLHLAVVYTINMEIATVTPPIGMNLFVLSSACDVQIEKIVKGMLPFYVLLILALVLIAYVPIISTWLPSTMK
ncbi:MAG: C4-dicarboxylate ABC transporter permease, partial [Deltaproteobacteria bacterium]